MPIYADIAFPTAVRRVFTYSIPNEINSECEAGKRVWVPFRNHFAIGIIIRLHNKKADFDVKPIRNVLDSIPVLSTDLLRITEWVHRFYFCSWGEAIQAALPSGLNFVSKEFVGVAENLKPRIFTKKEESILEDLSADKEWTLKEAKARWHSTGLNKVFNALLKEGVIEVWEKPEIITTVKTERIWVWAKQTSRQKAITYLNGIEKLAKWEKALQQLLELSLPIKAKELQKKEAFTAYTLSRLKEGGWIRSEEREVHVFDMNLPYEPDSIKQLNAEQESAYAQIESVLEAEEFANFLLYGITGSGKTEVYIHALKTIRAMGKTGIVLVPEIALTPQTVARFYRIFGDEIAVLHSRMNQKERLQEWKSLEDGTKSIAIGPRSAVFAPLKNLGLIILDEEHDGSYKQTDPAPRYHAREVAILRASLSNAVVVMGSATPSMQALHMAAKEKAHLLSLNERHADARLPEVQIVDLTQYTGAMKGPFSIPLYQSIKQSIEQNEQVILLYNRRGFANYMQCNTCGHIPQSPECSVSLTYHKQKNVLLCHYSGYARRADTHCERCGSSELLILGSGTQKIEEELLQWFPQAKVLRFDKDSTSRKGAHERILTAFAQHEADILIGTQLVAKGLDFPNVTTVGVVDADTEQAFPSFQSTERLFQLLSQVSGRSGRGTKPGKVIIQTRQSSNVAIQCAKTHDHKTFARQEMKFRKELNYPPFSRLIRFVFKGQKEHLVIQSAGKMHELLSKLLPQVEQLGPSPGAIGWVNKNYIWELTLKLDTDKGANYIEGVLSKIMDVYARESAKGTSSVRVNINVDAMR